MKAIGIILGILFILFAIVLIGSIIWLVIDKLVYDVMEIIEKDDDME